MAYRNKNMDVNFSKLSRSKSTFWPNYGTTGKSWKGLHLPLSISLWVYRKIWTGVTFTIVHGYIGLQEWKTLMWIFRIFSQSKWTIWPNYGTTGKSGQGSDKQLSMALLAYRNKIPWCKSFQFFSVKMVNLARTTELQENPDRGHFCHCPWLYWPTGIKYLDVNFSIFLSKMDNLVRTTELQENPDRGHCYHCPWL